MVASSPARDWHGSSCGTTCREKVVESCDKSSARASGFVQAVRTPTAVPSDAVLAPPVALRFIARRIAAGQHHDVPGVAKARPHDLSPTAVLPVAAPDLGDGAQPRVVGPGMGAFAPGLPVPVDALGGVPRGRFAALGGRALGSEGQAASASVEARPATIPSISAAKAARRLSAIAVAGREAGSRAVFWSRGWYCARWSTSAVSATTVEYRLSWSSAVVIQCSGGAAAGSWPRRRLGVWTATPRRQPSRCCGNRVQGLEQASEAYGVTVTQRRDADDSIAASTTFWISRASRKSVRVLVPCAMASRNSPISMVFRSLNPS
jgi:hypothetical protein